ncbi:efflux RND transporter periplasmic adaptor subunit [Phycisphaerales bacterium AB-hyl4]|uniref:Efflux RND transporter periplasmic adaptor subunit n=1 Tax=Natronomicrosphaera hydrolytica TaxID=3242702 RepID=A0ABV4U932_9BACT
MSSDTNAVAVEVVAVEHGPIRDTSTFASNLVARARFDVAPKISGRLERMEVDIGDTVERDEVVAWLDEGDFAQHVEEAKAELAVAQANLEEARSSLDTADREHRRVRSLREQDVASDAEMDASRSQYQTNQARLRVAEAQVSQREAALRAAEVRLDDTKVRATWPDNGHQQPRVVAQRFVDEGAMLSANTAVVSVVELTALRAVFFVTERDYQRLSVGQTAEVRVDSLPDEVFAGAVTRLSPVFRETSRQAEVVVEVANDERVLNPGMFARVELEFDQASEATLVPRSALLRRDDRQGVFVTTDRESVRFVPIETGIEANGLVQVIEPADLNGEVVVLGQHLVRDGSPILVVDDDLMAGVAATAAR